MNENVNKILKKHLMQIQYQFFLSNLKLYPEWRLLCFQYAYNILRAINDEKYNCDP